MIADFDQTSLASAALSIVRAGDLDEKIETAKLTAAAWSERKFPAFRTSGRLDFPDRPGRPDLPVLLPPRDMPKRSTIGPKGRFALLHSLAHIELNAIDMTWDLTARFAHAELPRAFLDDWVQVGLEEAKHLELVLRRLSELGGGYGDLPAHDGLWQAAQETRHDLLARIAVVPLVLEARGLDVSPAMIQKLEAAGDTASASILAVIYHDEKRHVATGMRWFRFLCHREGLPLERTFHRLVQQYFRGALKPPFNDAARSEAGLTPGFYKPLTAFGAPP